MAFARFLGDGRRVFTQTIVGDTAVWEVPVDARSVADWRALATLLSARRLNTAGSAEPVEAPALAELWRDLRARYAGDFLPGDGKVVEPFPITSLPPADAPNPFRLNSVFLQPH